MALRDFHTHSAVLAGRVSNLGTRRHRGTALARISWYLEHLGGRLKLKL